MCVEHSKPLGLHGENGMVCLWTQNCVLSVCVEEKQEGEEGGGGGARVKKKQERKHPGMGFLTLFYFKRCFI